MSVLLYLTSNILSIGLGYGIFQYYADHLCYPKESKKISVLISVLGYIALFCVSFAELPTLNIVSFFIVNTVILYFGFQESVGGAAFKAILLMIFMMFGELIIVFMFSHNVNNNIYSQMSEVEIIFHTILSKILYFISVVILKNLLNNKNRFHDMKKLIVLLVMPISTCMFLLLFNNIAMQLSLGQEVFFIVTGTMLICSNFIVYIVCDKMIEASEKMQYLEKVKHKNEIDNVSYQLIKEKYEELKIMVHDFDKYCNNIEGLINDRQEVLEQVQYIKNKNKEFLIIEYTDNKALNILLYQKVKECEKLHINFKIFIGKISFKFFKESDIVAVFANLLDNAIESCIRSKEKKIFLNISKLNESYMVIRLDNSADTAPIIEKEKLKTQKQNKEMHGIGMESIKNALKNYNGRIEWYYSNSTFSTVIMMVLNKPNF